MRKDELSAAANVKCMMKDLPFLVDLSAVRASSLIGPEGICYFRWL